MKLNHQEVMAYKSALACVAQINDMLTALRSLKIACNLREDNGRWRLEAKAIITEESLKEI